MISSYPLIWMNEQYRRDNSWWWAERLMLREERVPVYKKKENTELHFYENKPFLAELEIVGFSYTNRNTYVYLLDNNTRILYPTFAGFLNNLEIIRKLKNGKIKGIWIVKKKSAYYGIELID